MKMKVPPQGAGSEFCKLDGAVTLPFKKCLSAQHLNNCFIGFIKVYQYFKPITRKHGNEKVD